MRGPGGPRLLTPQACINVWYSDSCVRGTVAGVAVQDCQLCLFWDNSRNCPKGVATDSISHICSGDQFYNVIPSAGSTPVTGATNKRNTWWGGGNQIYCQWIRFNGSDATTTARFTIKDGNGLCRPAGASPLGVTINGLSATCEGPRTVNNVLAGCGTGDQANE
ncbi:hypothetical protein TSOC_007131, partial [Tetrabaena socialis]